MAVVTEVERSDDGLVRTATVKVAKTSNSGTTQHHYRRPICDLVLLIEGERRQVRDDSQAEVFSD